MEIKMSITTILLIVLIFVLVGGGGYGRFGGNPAFAQYGNYGFGLGGFLLVLVVLVLLGVIRI